MKYFLELKTMKYKTKVPGTHNDRDFTPSEKGHYIYFINYLYH